MELRIYYVDGTLLRKMRFSFEDKIEPFRLDRRGNIVEENELADDISELSENTETTELSDDDSDDMNIDD